VISGTRPLAIPTTSWSPTRAKLRRLINHWRCWEFSNSGITRPALDSPRVLNWLPCGRT